MEEDEYARKEAGRDISSFFESGKKSTSKSKELPTDDKFEKQVEENVNEFYSGAEFLTRPCAEERGAGCSSLLPPLPFLTFKF